jgi:hypothetical protein
MGECDKYLVDACFEHNGEPSFVGRRLKVKQLDITGSSANVIVDSIIILFVDIVRLFLLCSR